MEAANRLRREFFKKRGAYPALTTDVIVGFPGESEADFEECESFLRDIRFFETHIFKFSPRRGTAASNMEGQLTDRQKSERSKRLIELGKKNRSAFIDELIANESYESELLVEEYAEIDGGRYQVGHTGEYVKALIDSPEDLTGRIVKGKLEKFGYTPEGQEICIMREFAVK